VNMASAVNVGSINLPKMMRHLSHRTSQIRDLTFIRDPIYRKETKTTGTTGDTEGAGSTLAGPPVNFGYETSSYAQQDAGVDEAYHVNTPEIVLPGLKMLQSPIVSRSGSLERAGHRITGTCTFYAPSLSYIKALDNFKDTVAFSELESYDKLIDIERIIQNPVYATEQGGSPWIFTIKEFGAGDPITYETGWEIDRLQFKIKSTAGPLVNIKLYGLQDPSGNELVTKSLVWTVTDTPFVTTDWITVDLPLRDVITGDTQEVYINGVGKTFTATSDLDLDKLKGGDNTSYLQKLQMTLSNDGDLYLKDIYFYKEAEWRIESIRDYRDEYMQISASRIRGDRASRRRSYG